VSLTESYSDINEEEIN